MNDRSELAKMPPDAVESLRRLVGMIQAVPPALARVEEESAASGTDHADDAVLEDLSNWLYANWYTEDETQRATAPAPGRSDLATALAVATSASGQWETGWVTMQSSPNGVCVASRRSVMRELLPGQYANIARPGVCPQPGDGLSVCKLVDWVDRQTGFWHMQSSTGAPEPPLARLYWNVDWPHAGYVLRDLTHVLDDNEVRFSLKCPFRAVDYRRVDTVVVYLDRQQWDRLEPEIARVASALEHRLRRAVPPLTKTIGPGAAWSDDPGGSLSFGETRCRALAPAMRTLIRIPSTWSEDEGLLALMGSLRDAGIDPRRPWLTANA